MMGRIYAWYAGLTRRERVLVVAAAIIAGLVVLVYGIVVPVGRGLDAAAVRHAQAVERSGRLMAGLNALGAPGTATGQGAAGPIDQQVAASAEAAGFVIQSNQPRGNDATAVAIPAAAPAAALAWLDTLGGQGIAIESLTMTPSPGGTVAINVTLRRAVP